MINILLVDDHALVRRGIKRLLEDMPDMQVINEAACGEEALKLIRINVPDVVLLDMKMPGLDGWEVTRRLKKTAPSVKIIVITSLVTDSFPSRMFKLGAMGYITKESGPEEMAVAIRKVYKGEKYLSAEVAQKMAIKSISDNDSPFEKLSKREMQIMFMITRGMSVQEICNNLFLSSKTVNGYRYRIFEKLSIKNDVELTYLAIKYRLIESPHEQFS